MALIKEYVGSGRTLLLRDSANGAPSVNIGIVSNSGTNPTGVNLTDEQAVDLAVRILKRLDPDTLAPMPFVDLPNGTFLRRRVDALIVRVIPTPEGQDLRELADNNNWVEMENGKSFVAVQDANDPAWVVLDDDQVEVKTTWHFKI